MRVCNKTPLGKLCWNIYCDCDDRDDQVPELDVHQVLLAAVSRSDMCLEVECGWVTSCTDGNCLDYYCHCGDTAFVKEALDVAAVASFEVNPKLESDQAMYPCLSTDCGWVERCKQQAGVRLCWDMHCASGCAPEVHRSPVSVQ